MVSIMTKIDDASLNTYLTKHLQPLTEADPKILAKYVGALLKNNKPKKELEAFCIEKLFDFLGEDSKDFVVNLFHALEDGTISTNQDEHDVMVAEASSTAPAPAPAAVKVPNTGDNAEPRTSSQLDKYLDANSNEEEGTDDDDVDRNHKHRRCAEKSRSLDRDPQDSPLRKRNRPMIDSQPSYDTNNSLEELQEGANYAEKDGLPKRRLSRDHVSGAPSRSGGEVNQRATARGSPLFHSDGIGSRFEHQNGLSRGVLGRGRGVTTALWVTRDQRAAALDGLDFNLPMVPPGAPKNLYPGRSGSSRANSVHTSWTGYNRFAGMANATLDQALPINAGIQGTLGVNAALGVGMNMGIAMPLGRPRCPDFEERGYCLRGDLCLMEHGANRIVVEDVQSLSKFNLPVALPSGRGMTLSVPSSSLAPYSSNLGLTSMVMREANVPSLVDSSISKVTVGVNANTEPDLYDPDQPLWNKEQPSVLSDELRRFPSFKKGVEDTESENVALERGNRHSPDEGGYGGSAVVGAKTQGLTSGKSVWNRIGCIDQGKEDNVWSTDLPVASSQNLKAPKRELAEGLEPENLSAKGKNDNDERDAKVTRANLKSGVITTLEGERGLHSAGHNPLRSPTLRSPTERAQRTLYVGCIPSNANRKEFLILHFQKFGEIIDIRVPPHGDRAFVQFLRHEDAEAALTSPEAVMGNRFIRLSWARRDSVHIPAEESNAVPPSIGRDMCSGPNGVQGPVTEPSVVKGKRHFAASSSEVNAVKSGAKFRVQPSSSAVSQKKQEELEIMKEELRRKQEELAQKREDFRRKLERLSKQSSGVSSELESSQATGVMEPSLKVEQKGDEMVDREPEPVVEKQETAIKNGNKQTSVGPSIALKCLSATEQAVSSLVKDPSKQALGLIQAHSGKPSPRGLRGHPTWPSPGVIGYSQWTPLRYKLDNRTTVFRILSPFPDSLLDVPVLKEHFSCFGDVANVEIEDVDEGKHTVKVMFCTRNAAEKAFLQGRWYQGTSLQFSWVNPPPSSTVGVASSGCMHMENINSNPRHVSSGLIERGSEDVQSSKNQLSDGSHVEVELSVGKDAPGALGPDMAATVSVGDISPSKKDYEIDPSNING